MFKINDAFVRLSGAPDVQIGSSQTWFGTIGYVMRVQRSAEPSIQSRYIPAAPDGRLTRR